MKEKDKKEEEEEEEKERKSKERKGLENGVEVLGGKKKKR